MKGCMLPIDRETSVVHMVISPTNDGGQMHLHPVVAQLTP